ncbi:nucleolin 1-like isoform X3 [Argentina anserina]|uniref:nucleolin 1-like isoform X3 n=1 Tax=Argentina anserina TaxID=57926 RepID=UPI0021766503|nr:nucleolin 1-like isoform X3 [Potentilla anserina]
MGKSSKKSATKVEAAPAAVVPVSKSGKKGKREAENEIGKAVSAKKQKRDEAVAQAIQKTKVEAKTPKKKKEETSSSEDESATSSEDEKPAPKAKTVAPPKKQAIASKKEDSSSSESSDSDEDEKQAAKTAKNGTVAKKTESSDSSDSSDEEEVPKSKATKLPQVAAKNGKKKEESSSSDSSDDEDDAETPAKVTAPVKKVVAPPAKKADSSSSEDESDDESKNAKPAAKSPQPSKGDTESESESDSDEDDDEPQTNKPKAEVPAKAAQKESSSEEESDEDSSDDESEEEAKTPKKKDSDVEMVDAQAPSEKKAPKTPASADTSSSKTLFVGNLSFNIEQSDVEAFFKDVGQVVDVRFSSDPDGRFKGFGHVEFATAEEARKAVELNGSDLLGRAVKLDMARERPERGTYTPHSGKESNSYQKGEQGQSQTIFVRGFDTSHGEDEIRSALEGHFASCGAITRVSIPKDYETGGPKGMAYMDFSDADALSKALELDQSDLGKGCYLTVQPAKPRGDFGDRNSNPRFGDRDSRGGRRGGRFDSGGRRGGRFDSGGRRGGRDSGGRRGGRGRGPSLAAPGTGKKTTFNDED